MYNTNSQIKFKTTMLKSTLVDYNDVYLIEKGTTTVFLKGAHKVAIAANRINKVIFKTCAPFTTRVSETNNIQVDNAKDLEIFTVFESLC